MAFGLDTDSFLNALFRMAHRRCMPKDVISDNGTNFVGAAKELKQLISGLNSDVLKSNLANKSVKWLFNPPHAPYFGGVFESLVKSAKRAIYAILSSGDVSDEELMTAFTGAEALLNSRPLTYKSAHPQDHVPLTPNHFLHGQVGRNFAPELDSTSFSTKKQWRRVQELIRHVWKRWMREWLPTLNIRKKWITPSRDIQVDAVVIVVSPDTPRGVWPLGRVLKTYPGKDDHFALSPLEVSLNYPRAFVLLSTLDDLGSVQASNTDKAATMLPPTEDAFKLQIICRLQKVSGLPLLNTAPALVAKTLHMIMNLKV
ncbi:uncharacterized protein [Haliotis cracherodii]|uniref:uncharacterized protein n=1 Tax=Haliotis cracherodii TaxID=6455 RepID=UPI0039E9826E